MVCASQQSQFKLQTFSGVKPLFDVMCVCFCLSQTLYESVKARDPAQPEFLQAVEEVRADWMTQAECIT